MMRTFSALTVAQSERPLLGFCCTCAFARGPDRNDTIGRPARLDCCSREPPPAPLSAISSGWILCLSTDNLPIQYDWRATTCEIAACRSDRTGLAGAIEVLLGGEIVYRSHQDVIIIVLIFNMLRCKTCALTCLRDWPSARLQRPAQDIHPSHHGCRPRSNSSRSLIFVASIPTQSRDLSSPPPPPLSAAELLTRSVGDSAGDDDVFLEQVRTIRSSQKSDLGREHTLMF